MEKKKVTLFLSLIALFILALLLAKPFFLAYRNTDTIMNKIGSRIFEFNKIEVKVEDNLIINDFEIKLNSVVVFKNGKQQNKINNDYGDCFLKVFYKNRLISEDGHFKTNNWFTNDYYFIFSRIENEIEVKFKIEGPNYDCDFCKKKFVYDNMGILKRIEYFNINDSLYNIETKE